MIIARYMCLFVCGLSMKGYFAVAKSFLESYYSRKHDMMEVYLKAISLSL